MDPRKITEVWKSVVDQKPLGMPQKKWQQSYKGTSAALKSIDLVMETTREEFEAIKIPIDNKGKKAYSYRKIVVSRDGIHSKPTIIRSFISGNSRLLTDVEREIVYEERSKNYSISRPKGQITTITAESDTIDDFHKFMEIDKIFHAEHLLEQRLADVAYCMKGDDINDEVFVANQVKTSCAEKIRGCLHFCHDNGPITVGAMLSILEKGLSLTCIGKTHTNVIDVVWLFHGNDAIDTLKIFKIEQYFTPILHLKLKSINKFTTTYNDRLFRFDIGSSESERLRLRERMLEIVTNSAKYSLKFLNEDDSHIVCKTHRIEQKSFEMTRTACAAVGTNIKRVHEDAYSSVDFRVNDVIRIQDKAVINDFRFNIRRDGGYPYNPDDIDALQITFIVDKIVFLLPMRVRQNDKIVSFFTEDQLVKCGVSCGKIWQETNASFKYDLNTEEGIRSYIAACENSHDVPQLTDREFFSNIIRNNEDKFGSAKKMKERRANNIL
jgi:hypothetical protein